MQNDLVVAVIGCCQIFLRFTEARAVSRNNFNGYQRALMSIGHVLHTPLFFEKSMPLYAFFIYEVKTYWWIVYVF
jgi:hypothetical protein